FVLPALVLALLLFCVAVVFLVTGGTSGWLVALLAAVLIYELAMFLVGVAPVGRLIYIEQGYIEDALGARSLRAALRPGARGVYARARLRSLPAYLPALLLLAGTWAVVRAGQPGAWVAGLLLLWLAASALLYAHLVVAQLYVMAEREARYL